MCGELDAAAAPKNRASAHALRQRHARETEELKAGPQRPAPRRAANAQRPEALATATSAARRELCLFVQHPDKAGRYASA